MTSQPALVVLAAGIGSRFGGLKQMEPLGPGGEAVLDYSVFDARRAGFGRVVFVIRRELEASFREALGRRFEARLEVRYAHQELDRVPPGFAVPPERRKPWGTGHAALCAAEQVDGPFAVINADDFYGAESFRALARFLSTPASGAGPARGALVGFRLRNTLSAHGTVARGVCSVNADGELERVEELTAIERFGDGARHRETDGRFRALTGEEIVSMNCWGFDLAAFGHLRRRFAAFLAERGGEPGAEFYLPAAVTELIGEGAVCVTVLPTRATWFGVTYREDRAEVAEQLRALVARGEYPAPLWE